MTPAAADAYVAAAAAYVHVPFCSSVCPYCDFAVVAGRDDLIERYFAALRREISATAPWRPLESVYFGGGTPSHVDPDLLGSVLDLLKTHHGVAADAEISLEANPEDFEPSRAVSLVESGFNRVSFGAQSFDGAVLLDLGRRHGVGEIASSVEAAREAGFGSVSMDLIYGTPGESDDSWLRSVRRALDMGIDHLSAYALTVEGGTPLGRAVAAGAPSPDPDTQADRYEIVDQMASAAGLARYEVSNWAKPGHECRYNLTVWAQGEYEAYGNGAHGFRHGIRFRNHRRIDAYIEQVELGDKPRAGAEEVSGWDGELDRLFVGLRRQVGVASGPGTAALLDSEEGKLLEEAGVIAIGEGRVRVSRPLLTDAVHRSVLSLPAPIVTGDGDA